jgi:excisionase family DNA binding protein
MATKYLSARDIARTLDVAEQTAYRWIWDGTLPAVRIHGRLVRVSEDDFNRFLASREPFLA